MAVHVDQSDHSTLNSLIRKAFRPTELLLAMFIALFFCAKCVNCVKSVVCENETVVWENARRSGVS